MRALQPPMRILPCTRGSSAITSREPSRSQSRHPPAPALSLASLVPRGPAQLLPGKSSLGHRGAMGVSLMSCREHIPLPRLTSEIRRLGQLLQRRPSGSHGPVPGTTPIGSCGQLPPLWLFFDEPTNDPPHPGHHPLPLSQDPRAPRGASNCSRDDRRGPGRPGQTEDHRPHSRCRWANSGASYWLTTSDDNCQPSSSRRYRRYRRYPS